MSGFTYGSAQQTCQGIHTTHTGLEAYAIDFGLNFEEVDAAAYRQVGAEGYDPLGGNYIWIQHPNNMQTYYGHLSAFSVNTGDTVSKGQRIGTSGNSGPSGTAAHLHFRVTAGGTAPFGSGTPYKPEPMSGTGPPGYMGWDSYGCNLDTATTFISTPPNEQVSVAPKPDGTATLLLRGTDAKIYYDQTDIWGTPGSWSPVGDGVGDAGVGFGAPCATWNSGGTRLDVYVIGTDNWPWRKSRINGLWESGWTKQVAAPSSGNGETENINCTRRPDGTIDLFMRGISGDGIHMSTNSSFDVASWDTLGGAVKGPPSGVWDANQTRMDVYTIGNNDWPYHGVWTPSSQFQWTDVYPSGLAGQAESEMIYATRWGTGSIDVYLRGGGQNIGVAYHGYTDASGNITSWESLSGIVRSAPQSRTTTMPYPPYPIRKDAYAIGNSDQTYQITWIAPGPWSSWQYWASQVAA